MADTTTPLAQSSAPCLEIAVYTVRASEADAFPQLQAALHVALQDLPGFIASERLRGVNTPTLFSDYIQWASRAAAEAAAAQMPTLPDGEAFVGAIETMHTFAHLPLGDPSGNTSAS